MKRLLALVLVLTVIVFPIAAQDSTTLVPFTDAAYSIQGVMPEGWTKVSPGAYARGSSATDTTMLAIQAAPLPLDQLVPALLPQFGLSEMPEPVSTTETDAFVWTDYAFDLPIPGVSISLRVSLAHSEGMSYIVLLQANTDEVDALAEAVYAPVRDALAPLGAAGEPVSYIEEEVIFTNGDVTLAGTLTLPEGAGPHPAVVLMTGSGPQNRDEQILPGFPIFKYIADHLTPLGIAVLRYDDRGVAESTGDYAAATLQDLASDGKAAVAYLRSRADINPDEVGVLGHSEGGAYSAMLGADPDSGIAFIISMAGTAVNGLDLLKVQNQRIIEASGLGQDAIDAQLAFLDAAYPLAVARDWDAVAALAYEQAITSWETLTAEEQAALGGNADAFAAQSVEQFTAGYANEWFATMLTYDPAVDWAQTTVPVLGIFGALDVQVDAEQNATALEAALTEAGNTDFEIVTLPDANHVFQSAITGNIDEYGILDPVFTEAFLPTISEWLLPRVTVAQN